MVFGLFSKERKLKRAIAKANNKLAQSPDRWAAMERLADEGSDEALLALCKRFSFTYDKTIEDQQEKEWVKQTLIGKGSAALVPLRRYMKSATSVAYPLTVLQSIAAPDKVLEVIDELLADEEPGYTRDPGKRNELIIWIGEYKGITDAQAAARVAPYVADFDENVRFSAIEALDLRRDDCAAEPLAARLADPDEESGRIKKRLAEVLADSDLDLGEHKQAIAGMLDGELSDFRLHRDRLQRKKKAAGKST